MSTTITSTLFHGSRALEAASSTGGQPVGPPPVAPPKVAAAASASHGGGPEARFTRREGQPETLRRAGRRDNETATPPPKDDAESETPQYTVPTRIERGEVPLLLSSAPRDPEARLETLEDVREQVAAEQPPSAQRRWISTTAMVQTTSARVELHLSRAREAYAEPPPPPGDSVDAKV